MEQSTVNQRLNLIVDTFEKGVKAAFARKAGISPQGAQEILAGRKGDPSFKVLVKILESYPVLDANWLVLGRGEMLKEEGYKSVETPPDEAPSPKSLEEVVQQLVATELNRRHINGQVSTAWAKQSGDIQLEISQLVGRAHELIMQMHEIIINKNQNEEDKARYIDMHAENERITKEVLRKRAEIIVLQQADIQAVQEAQATVYRIEGKPDITKPFGGLLSYRLGISSVAAQQLVADNKIRSVEIEGEGHRISEQAVREFLRESESRKN
jgi:transcriptional regulator with XRE-family HTH domain